MGFVDFAPDGGILVSAQTVPELKIAKKELQLRKRELMAERKQIQSEIAELRLDYRSNVAHRTPLLRGCGKIGFFARGAVQVNRARERGSHNDDLRPLETQKMALDAQMLGIDQVIAQVDAAILRAS